jgi:hypothetical protein
MHTYSILFLYNSKFHQINIVRFSNTTIMQIQAIVLLLVATVSAWVIIIPSESISRN